MVNWNEDEKKLYARSRALKMQARELRKYRLEKEAAAKYNADREAELAKSAALKKQADTTKERDDRIRKALLSMNDSFRVGGLKIEGPDSWSAYGSKKPCFRVYDTKTLQWVQINTTHNGFQWD